MERISKTVDANAADAIISNQEAQGWRLVSRNPQQNDQVTLVFEHAPLPEFRDETPKKARKKVPLRRRLRNYAIVASIPLTIMCCLVTYIGLTNDSVHRRAVNETVMRFLRASFYGRHYVAADETCTEYHSFVQESSANPPAEWNIHVTVEDAAVDGGRAVAQVSIHGYVVRDGVAEPVMAQDQILVVRDGRAWQVCDARLDRGVWNYLFE